MPLREFGCQKCGEVVEKYHSSIDPSLVPVPKCEGCKKTMTMLYSVPRIDTSSTFQPFEYSHPTINRGKKFMIDNLHKLRQVEHDSLKTGHNIRFDAYSANPSNPDSVDGFGQEYWSGDHKDKGTTTVRSMPTMDN